MIAPLSINSSHAGLQALLAARRAPQLEAGEPTHGEQRLTDDAGGSMHEHALKKQHSQ
jgi:hypothetical protein